MKKTKIVPLEDYNYTIKDLSIEEIVPNNIDNYLVSIYENHHLIVLPNSVMGEQFKNWKKSRGGQFSKDVLYYTLKKFEQVAKYVLIKGNGKYFIARIIAEEEKLDFEALKLIDGQIKDISYMILRHLNEDDTLTNTKLSMFNTEEELKILEFYPSITNIPIHDEELDYHGGSISLFSD